jgi:hypothetical protein
MVGILLIAYKGYSKFEDWVLNVAGTAAIGVALFPMPWGTDRSVADLALSHALHTVFSSANMPSFHYVCAGLHFLLLALICFYACYDAYRHSLLPQYKSYLAGYIVCGLVMASLPVVAGLLSHIPDLKTYRVFIIEAIGVWGFAAYWCIKSFEIDEHHRIQNNGLAGRRPSLIAPVAGVLTVLAVAIVAAMMWKGTDVPAVPEVHLGQMQTTPP